MHNPAFFMPHPTCMAASLHPSSTAMMHHSFHMPFRCARVRLAAKAHCVCVCAHVRVSRCYLSGHHLRAGHSRSSESSYGQSNQPLHRNDLATQVPKSHCHCLDVHTVTRTHGRERGREKRNKGGRVDRWVRRTRKVRQCMRRGTEVNRLTE